jgi:hypothetical protein
MLFIQEVQWLWRPQQGFEKAETDEGEAEEDDEEDNLALFYGAAAAFFDQADQPVGDKVNDNGVQGKEDEI